MDLIFFPYLKGIAFIFLIVGFVMIWSPDKFLTASHAVEEVMHEEINLSELDDPDIAKNVTEEIKHGQLSPHEQKHYELGLMHVQKKGIKGKLTISLIRLSDC